jgi:hypothetical protein
MPPRIRFTNPRRRSFWHWDFVFAPTSGNMSSFLQCWAAYSVLFGWKLAYKGLTGQHVDNVVASQAITLFILTLFQCYIPPPLLNPVGAWAELSSGARSLSSALSSTLLSFGAAAAAVQLFVATLSHAELGNLAIPHARINVGEIFLHIAFLEACVSVTCVLFVNQLIKLVPAFKSAPTFPILNVYLLLQLQTPLMAILGNVNPASAFASILIHQQPLVTLAQIFGNILAIALHSYANQLFAHRASLIKDKQD